MTLQNKNLINKKTTDSIDKFINNYDEQVQTIAFKLRAFLNKEIPGIIEYLDIPAKMISYGFSNKYSDMLCTIFLSIKGVKLGLFRGSELSDPENLLSGSGKVHKYAVIKSEKDIKNPAIKKLIKEAYNAYLKRREKI